MILGIPFKKTGTWMHPPAVAGGTIMARPATNAGKATGTVIAAKAGREAAEANLSQAARDGRKAAVACGTMTGKAVGRGKGILPEIHPTAVAGGNLVAQPLLSRRKRQGKVKCQY